MPDAKDTRRRSGAKYSLLGGYFQADEDDGPPEDDPGLATDEPRLFQMGNPWCEEAPWNLGLAAGQARPGDLVCLTANTKRAIVVRRTDDRNSNVLRYQAVGTSMVAEDDGTKDMADHSGYLQSAGMDDIPRFRVVVDAWTVYLLLS
jgi:hypothetical protein